MDEGARYAVLANSQTFQTGSYRLFFSEEIDDVRQVDEDELPARSASGRGAKLAAQLSANKHRK